MTTEVASSELSKYIYMTKLFTEVRITEDICQTCVFAFCLCFTFWDAR